MQWIDQQDDSSRLVLLVLTTDPVDPILVLTTDPVLVLTNDPVDTVLALTTDPVLVLTTDPVDTVLVLTTDPVDAVLMLTTDTIDPVLVLTTNPGRQSNKEHITTPPTPPGQDARTTQGYPHPHPQQFTMLLWVERDNVGSLMKKRTVKHGAEITM